MTCGWDFQTVHRPANSWNSEDGLEITMTHTSIDGLAVDDDPNSKQNSRTSSRKRQWAEAMDLERDTNPSGVKIPGYTHSHLHVFGIQSMQAHNFTGPSPNPDGCTKILRLCEDLERGALSTYLRCCPALTVSQDLEPSNNGSGPCSCEISPAKLWSLDGIYFPTHYEELDLSLQRARDLLFHKQLQADTILSTGGSGTHDYLDDLNLTSDMLITGCSEHRELKQSNSESELKASRLYGIWTIGCILREVWGWILNDFVIQVDFPVSQTVKEHTEIESPLYEASKSKYECPWCRTLLGGFNDHHAPLWSEIWMLNRAICSVETLEGNSLYSFLTGARDVQISASLHSSNRNLVMDETCQWILDNDEFVRWRTERDSLLWLSGSPGTGKSVLTSTVVTRLEADRRMGDLIVPYYFDHDYKGGNPIPGLLWGILIKLLLRESRGHSREKLRSVLKDLFHVRERLSTSRMKFAMSVIKHSLRENETLYLLLDGLDEAEKQDQDLLHEFINHASQPDPYHRIKFFISTRPSFFEDRTFERPLKLARRVDLDAHPFRRHDLALYIHKSLMERNLADGTPESKKLEQWLVEKASGSFLWVRLIMNTIQLSPSPRAALKTIGEILASSTTPEIHEIYEVMLGQVVKAKQHAVLSMLRWVTYASRPLHLRELLGALQMQTGIELKISSVSDASAGLLVSNGSQIVRLAHSTVRQFLKVRMKSNWSAVTVEAHETIARTCLEALCPQCFLTSLGIPSCGKHSITEDSSNCHKSLSRYARRNWIFHYSIAERESRYLAGFLHSLLARCIQIHDSRLPGAGCSSPEKRNKKSNSSGLLVGKSFALKAINTGLLVGARFGFRRLVKLEIEMGADVNKPHGPHQLTPISWASQSGYLDIVEVLLKNGANLRCSSTNGDTPLSYAIRMGHLEIVELLLSHEAQQHSTIDEHGIASNTDQYLSLMAVETETCEICGAVDTDYQITAEDDNLEENRGSRISITGERQPTSQDRALPTDIPAQQNREATITAAGVKRKTRIKWFLGLQMRKALKFAAKRGIEDIRKLLVLAGNDLDVLEKDLSMSKLVSHLRVA